MAHSVDLCAGVVTVALSSVLERGIADLVSRRVATQFYACSFKYESEAADGRRVASGDLRGGSPLLMLLR
jgi:hypothetical protein